MEIFITALHISLCFFLILVVLLQPGKGADFGAAMGGASGEIVSASGGVSLLGRLTALVAALFMLTSLTLAWFSNRPSATDIDLDDMREELEAERATGSGTEADPDASEADADVPDDNDKATPEEVGEASEGEVPTEAAPADEDPGADPEPAEPTDEAPATEGDAEPAEQPASE
jgi:preprotein translocase subunit SecG